MNRTLNLAVVVVLLAVGGGASAQQVMAPAQAATRPTASRTTRSYRSYSVSPGQRADGRQSQQATWRDAGAKPAGHYATGR